MALILSAFSVALWIQCLVFVLVSFLLLIFLRKLLTKFLQTEEEKTNTESFIGNKYTLTKEITEGENGKILINGVEWVVATENETSHKAGEKVIVIKIKGNRLIVKGEKK